MYYKSALLFFIVRQFSSPEHDELYLQLQLAIIFAVKYYDDIFILLCSLLFGMNLVIWLIYIFTMKCTIPYTLPTISITVVVGDFGS